IEVDVVRPGPLRVRAGGGDELEHRLDVADARNIRERHRLVGEQAGGDDRERAVLVPGSPDAAVERVSTLDDEGLRHRRDGHAAASIAGRPNGSRLRAGGNRRQVAQTHEGDRRAGVESLRARRVEDEQRAAVDPGPATVGRDLYIAARSRVADEDARLDPEADVAAADLHRVVDVVVGLVGVYD